jgi:AcrR family transcriptional regulator
MTRLRPDVRRRAQARRAATEREILDATERLLEVRTFRDLTIADVMAEAGATRTAFYRYFPDLGSLLLRRLGEVNVEMEEARDRWLAESDDPVGSLLDSARAFAGIFHRHGRLLLALAHAASGAPEVDTAWRALVDGFTAITAARLAALCRRGLCVLDDPAEMTRALVCMTEHYLLDTFGRGSRVPVERAAACIALVWERTLFAGARAPAAAGPLPEG